MNQLINKIITKRLLTPIRKYTFSIYSNQHHSVKEVINGKEIIYDHNIQRYEPTIQAYLQKRWTKKSEIPAKIYIIKQLKSIESALNQQKLYSLQKLHDQSRLDRMNENGDFNSAYIMSIYLEEYFKPMCDEYLKKVLINGQVVPMDQIQEYKKIRSQVKYQLVIKLYNTFFFGDELTDLEKEIEIKYLFIKQRKFFRYQASQKSIDKCLWTYSQQRRVESIINWRARDLNLYDDFRPFYQPLRIESKLKQFYTIFHLNQEKWTKRIYFEIFEKRRFLRSRKRTDWFITYLFTRTMLYTHSIEFIRGIPPDFHIEHSVVNLHIWMMIDRMKKIGTAESKYAYKILDEYFGKYTAQEIGKIHLRKKNDFIRDVDSYMKVSRNYLDYHFNKNQVTIKNNYYKLDALVWSVIFFEKIPRYSEQVYLMTEYVKANYDYVQGLDFDKFIDSDIQFDVYRISMDFKDKILAVNPPMDEKDFIEEFHSDKKKKKYYYSYDLGEQFQMPMEIEGCYNKNNSILQKKLFKMHENMIYSYKKFLNLQTYDHFSKLEEQRQEIKDQQTKYIWSKQNDQESQDIDQIKKQIRQIKMNKE